MPYKQGEKYRAVVKFKGQRHTKLKGTRKEAIKWEVEKRKELERDESTQHVGTDLLTFLTKYLDYAETNFTSKVYHEKRALIDKILGEWSSDLVIKDVTPQMVFNYLLNQKNDRSANAANKDRKNLSAVFNWGQQVFGYDEIPFNPVERIKKFKHEPKPQETYTEEEILKLLLAADRLRKLILNTYLETAGRRMEVLTLSWADVNIEKRAVRLWTRKNRDGTLEGEWLPISEDLAREFEWWFKNRRKKIKDSVWVFPNQRTGKPYVDPRKWFKNWCEKAGVRVIGFHALRRYVASILDDKHKVSKKAIQRLLRHKKESTTERYLQMIHSDLAVYAGLARPEVHQDRTPNEKGVTTEKP